MLCSTKSEKKAQKWLPQVDGKVGRETQAEGGAMRIFNVCSVSIPQRNVYREIYKRSPKNMKANSLILSLMVEEGKIKKK